MVYIMVVFWVNFDAVHVNYIRFMSPVGCDFYYYAENNNNIRDHTAASWTIRHTKCGEKNYDWRPIRVEHSAEVLTSPTDVHTSIQVF